MREILEQAAVDQLRAALPGFGRVRVEFRHETTDSSKFPYWFAPRSLADLPERPRAFSNDTRLPRRHRATHRDRNHHPAHRSVLPPIPLGG
ncbi:hypothetical protein [Nocardia wallacei]|uniref:hypothetical protein n=1 Tax=Nocardia wallacei TaxID=480035 RepID=UPI00245881F7|nr:hypothetical protein [Nocardia wallacei]